MTPGQSHGSEQATEWNGCLDRILDDCVALGRRVDVFRTQCPEVYAQLERAAAEGKIGTHMIFDAVSHPVLAHSLLKFLETEPGTPFDSEHDEAEFEEASERYGKITVAWLRKFLLDPTAAEFTEFPDQSFADAGLLIKNLDAEYVTAAEIPSLLSDEMEYRNCLRRHDIRKLDETFGG